MTDDTKQKFAHEEARDAKARQQRIAQEEKRRNSLPRFLLVRSGFWSAWLFPICTATAACMVPYENGHNSGFYFWLLLTAISTCAAGINSKKRKALAKDDIKIIQQAMTEYTTDTDYVLDLSRVRNFPNMTSILVRHITKHNPGIFDRFIANPKSIPDNEAMQDIISAYLDKHSDAAPKILEALKQIQTQTEVLQYVPGEDRPQPTGEYKAVLPVSYELWKRLERCARRMGGGTKRR